MIMARSLVVSLCLVLAAGFQPQPLRTKLAPNATLAFRGPSPSRALPLSSSRSRLGSVAEPLSEYDRGLDTKKSGLFARMGKGYMARLEKKPIITKVLTAIVLSAISDLVGQQITANPGDPFNVQRFLAFVASQSFVCTPLCHYLLEGIEKWGIFASRYVGKKGKPFAMVLLDQSLSATTVFTCFFMSFTIFEAALHGFPTGALASGQEAWSKVVSTIVPTMMASWKIWPVANLINFAYLPINLRLPFISTVSCGFNIILSILAAK